MILLAAEQRLVASEIAAIVRESAETVRRWFRRYQAEGVKRRCGAGFAAIRLKG
jgi:transposase